MNKKLPYDLAKDEIEDLQNQKKKIRDFVMKQFNREQHLSEGKPHVFKMTLDDGWATYQYDITLNENWCMFDIQNEMRQVLEKYSGTISNGELIGNGYNEKKNN